MVGARCVARSPEIVLRRPLIIQSKVIARRVEQSRGGNRSNRPRGSDVELGSLGPRCVARSPAERVLRRPLIIQSKVIARRVEQSRGGNRSDTIQ